MFGQRRSQWRNATSSGQCVVQQQFFYKVLPDTRVGNRNEEGNKVTESTLRLIESPLNRNTKTYLLGIYSFYLHSYINWKEGTRFCSYWHCKGKKRLSIKRDHKHVWKPLQHSPLYQRKKLPDTKMDWQQCCHNYNDTPHPTRNSYEEPEES